MTPQTDIIPAVRRILNDAASPEVVALAEMRKAA